MAAAALITGAVAVCFGRKRCSAEGKRVAGKRAATGAAASECGARKHAAPKRLAPRHAAAEGAAAEHADAKHTAGKRAARNRRGMPLAAAVLLLLAVSVGVGGTAAIYTSQVFQRSVVRNRDTETIRFSSDKLFRINNGNLIQKYYYPMAKGERSMTFQVCNYDQAKNTVFSEKTIDYTLAVQVANGTENFNYTISRGIQSWQIENGMKPINGSLTGAKRSIDTYTIHFAEGDYNKVEVTVTVTPTDLTLTRQSVLGGILTPIEYASTQGVTMRYEFTDSHRIIGEQPASPDQFDAYNLSVSISGGAGNAVISWDANALDIDPFFVEKVHGTSGTAKNGYTTLTVPMNAEDETGAYLIRFYNHNSVKPNWKTWNELPIRVELQGTASAATPTT